MGVARWSLQLFAWASLLSFAPLSARAGLQFIARGSNAETTACALNANPSCQVQQGFVDDPILGPHNVMRSSSVSSPTGSSAASATSNSDATYNAATGVLDFTGDLSGNASASNENPIAAASQGRANGGGNIDGSYTGSYRFTVSANMAIPRARNDLSFSDNNCRILIRAGNNNAVIFDESLQGPGSRTVSANGMLPAGTAGSANFNIEVRFTTTATTGSAFPTDNSEASMSFAIRLIPDGCEGIQCEPFHWTNPNGGNFSEPKNWSRMAVPGPTDEARFDLPLQMNAVPVQANNNVVDLLGIDHMRIDLTGSLQSRRMTLQNGSNLSLQSGATLALTGFTIIDGAGLELAGAGTQLNGVESVQIINDAAVLVAQGALLDAQNTVSGIRLGEEGSPSCLLQVLQAGVVRTPVITVATGELRIASGGSVEVADSCKLFQGSFNVEGVGTGSSRLDIGGAFDMGGRLEPSAVGTGPVQGDILNGGTVRAGSLSLGDRNQMFAYGLRIAGVGPGGQRSSLVLGGTDGLKVLGTSGTQMEVADGALLSTFGAVRLGLLGDTGKVVVRGSAGIQPSTLTAFEMLIGSSAEPAEMVVEDGARVTITDRLFLGPNSGELGRVILSESDSSISAGILIVGADGDGELIVSSGARLTSTTASIGERFLSGTGTGSVTIGGTPLSSSEWQVMDDCEIGNGEPGTVKLLGTTLGPFSVGGATLNVGGTLTVNTAGSVVGNGTLTAGARVVNGGFISPGLSPGVIAIDGDYEQTANGKLKIQVGGLGDGQSDGVHVTGAATLGGTLELTFLNGYLPRSGDTFRFLEVEGNITGEFAQVTFPQLLPGFQFDTAVVPGGLQFTALNDAVLKHRALNISTRLEVEDGDNVLIGGFIVTGNDAKKVILRAIGPSLAGVGLTGFLQDPVLELHDNSGALLASNDNWRTGGQETEIIASTVPPTDDLESAIVRTLPAGAYTAIVRGTNGGSGIGLVEAYDLDGNVDSKLGNISTRGRVQTGDNVMIGGFIVGGGGGGTTRFIIRAIGPSIAPVVPGALGNPNLALHDGNGTAIATNDNWRSDQEAEIMATGIAPTDDLESAIVQSLVPGPYTAIVRGVGEITGVALVEVYSLD